MKIKRDLILSLPIGGVIGVLCELLHIYHRKVIFTHEPRIITIMLITSFFEGAFLLLLLMWRNRLCLFSSLRSYALYASAIVFYFFIRKITMIIGLLISQFTVVIFPLRGMLLERFIDVSSLLIDLLILLLIFYPLLTLGKKLVEKSRRKDMDSDNSPSVPSDQT